MLPPAKQQQLIARYALIEDPQERLAILVDRARKLQPLPDSDKTDGNRVEGCSSRVWLLTSHSEGLCRFQIDADSTLVKGLAALLVEIYDGVPAAEVAAFEPTLLEALHLSDHLSPTRRHGLAQIRAAIRDFARRC